MKRTKGNRAQPSLWQTEDLPLFSGTAMAASNDAPFSVAVLEEPAPQLKLNWGPDTHRVDVYSRDGKHVDSDTTDCPAAYVEAIRGCGDLGGITVRPLAEVPTANVGTATTTPKT